MAQTHRKGEILRTAAVDWESWTPRQRATLTFIFHNGQVLLIHKKRGLGAGKISAPGGRLEEGETPVQAAVREVQEEVGVTPVGLSCRGELAFQFVDGLSMYIYVFSASGFVGEPRSTAEADPLWFPVDRIPYGRMWADDSVWLPLLLAGEEFRGRFVFDGDEMLEHFVTTGKAAQPGRASAPSPPPNQAPGGEG